jgi:VRR-NUC domain
MTRFARRGHHDANHGELAKVFEDLGCTVADTSAAGFGFPDIVLGLIGQTHLVEVKDTDGRLSASQERFIRDWRGGRIVVIETAAEAIAHVQAIRRAAR